MSYDYLRYNDVYDDSDPEVEDAANNHGQDISMEELGKPKPSFAKERTMNNNVKLIQRPQRGISASTLSVGEYASVTGTPGDTGYGDIVLRTILGVVSLTTPTLGWEGPFDYPQVERLNTGDKLEITMGFTPEFEERVRREAQINRIMAIKLVRTETNWGLKESKDYVDALLLKF